MLLEQSGRGGSVTLNIKNVVLTARNPKIKKKWKTPNSYELITIANLKKKK